MVTTVKYDDGAEQGTVEVKVADDGFLILDANHADDGTVSLAFNLAEAVDLMANLAAAINQMTAKA